MELSEPGIAGRSFRWYLTDEGAVYPDHEGAAVFTRPDQARAVHALAMKAGGARIVAEVDDNYLADPSQNVGMRMHYDKDSGELFTNALACFDALVTSTDYLRDRYRKALRPMAAKLDYHVVGNHVDPADWPEPVPSTGKLRVGWMGSDSHFRDIKLAYPALQWAAEAGHEVVLIGYDPRWHPQCAVAGISGLRRGELFGFPYLSIPWVDPQHFKRAAYPLDVALAPLERTDFNLGKSDVKFLEYTMSGAATVASNVEVYSRSIRHGETGLLAGSREELLRCVQRLCADRGLRDRLAKNAAQYVREERCIDQHADEWREAVLA
jgi:glycosyltransferase involved in cell wall biosynthesis